MAEIVKHEGKDYVRMGDKLIPVDHFDENGKPVIVAVWSEETPNANGGQDCTVHVPCFQIAGKVQKPG